ncbi:MAG: SDR family oxidoreductase [Planctomycetota bacterium]|nr:MAG: SDR family oxidoreductase [Planctomycetota bacterium]
MRLQDCVAVVTGAGSGLGRAAAELFAREGAFVLLVGRTRDKLEAVAGGIRASGGACGVEAADVGERGAMQRAVDALVRAHGRVDALVASAGVVIGREAALETTEEDWSETLRINLTGVHYSCLAVLAHMVAQQRGAIVTISSIGGQVAVPRRASYAASKGGVIAYTRNLAVDYARYGVRANCVCPAFVETDLNRASLAKVKADPEKWQALLRMHPLGLGQPEDVAQAALFLCSDESRWITGVDLSVDGGYTAL